MDISALDVTALKALAYDLILERERIQANLNTVTQEIALRATQARTSQPPPPEPADDPAALQGPLT